MMNKELLESRLKARKHERRLVEDDIIKKVKIGLDGLNCLRGDPLHFRNIAFTLLIDCVTTYPDLQSCDAQIEELERLIELEESENEN